MNIVIIGYGELFRASIFGLLNTEHEIIGVLTHDNVLFNPIKKFFFRLFTPDSDYNFIKSQKLKLIKANSVNSKKFQKELQKLRPDLIVTASWSEKFGQETINIPKHGCINIHPSLLPKYRGPNPYLQVILNNEIITGVTFHLMDNNYDTGAIIYQKEVKILPEDTGESLKLRCCDTVRNNIAFALNNFEEKLENKIPQDEKNSSYQKRITLYDTILDFEKESSEEISRRIRALTPWHECHICYKDEFFTFKSYKITSESSQVQAGLLTSKTDNSISIVCKDGKIIEFSELLWKRYNNKTATKFYLKYFIKV